MILEILKLNGSVLLAYLYFKHTRVACSKLVQDHQRKETNKAPVAPYIETLLRHDVARFKTPLVIATLACRNVF